VVVNSWRGGTTATSSSGRRPVAHTYSNTRAAASSAGSAVIGTHAAGGSCAGSGTMFNRDAVAAMVCLKEGCSTRSRNGRNMSAKVAISPGLSAALQPLTIVAPIVRTAAGDEGSARQSCMASIMSSKKRVWGKVFWTCRKKLFLPPRARVGGGTGACGGFSGCVWEGVGSGTFSGSVCSGCVVRVTLRVWCFLLNFALTTVESRRHGALIVAPRWVREILSRWRLRSREDWEGIAERLNVVTVVVGEVEVVEYERMDIDISASVWVAQVRLKCVLLLFVLLGMGRWGEDVDNDARSR